MRECGKKKSWQLSQLPGHYPYPELLMLMYAYISITKYSYDNLETSLDNGRPDLTQKETAWKEIM